MAKMVKLVTPDNVDHAMLIMSALGKPGTLRIAEENYQNFKDNHANYRLEYEWVPGEEGYTITLTDGHTGPEEVDDAANAEAILELALDRMARHAGE